MDNVVLLAILVLFFGEGAFLGIHSLIKAYGKHRRSTRETDLQKQIDELRDVYLRDRSALELYLHGLGLPTPPPSGFSKTRHVLASLRPPEPPSGTSQPPAPTTPRRRVKRVQTPSDDGQHPGEIGVTWDSTQKEQH